MKHVGKNVSWFFSFCDTYWQNTDNLQYSHFAPANSSILSEQPPTHFFTKSPNTLQYKLRTDTNIVSYHNIFIWNFIFLTALLKSVSIACYPDYQPKNIWIG